VRARKIALRTLSRTAGHPACLDSVGPPAVHRNSRTPGRFRAHTRSPGILPDICYIDIENRWHRSGLSRCLLSQTTPTTASARRGPARPAGSCRQPPPRERRLDALSSPRKCLSPQRVCVRKLSLHRAAHESVSVSPRVSQLPVSPRSVETVGFPGELVPCCLPPWRDLQN